MRRLLGVRPPPVVLLGAAAVAAVAATWLPVALHHRDPDVVNLGAGLVLLLGGAQLVGLRSTRRTGSWLALASLAWFAPDLAGDVGSADPVLGATVLAHVPLLVGAVLSAPEERWQARRHGPVLTLSVVAAASASTGGYQVLVPATGLTLLLSGMRTWLASPRRGSRPAGAYLTAVLAAASAFTGVPAGRLLLPGTSDRWWFTTYAALLATAAVALVAVGPWLRRAASVDVGTDALATLDRLLKDVTGDPSAHAVARVGDGTWVRLDGTPSTTPVGALEHGPYEVAVVASTGSVPAPLAAAVTSAVQLAGNNVRARWEVADRVRQLDRLRLRLIRVEDDERATLVADLKAGPLAALAALHAELDAAGAAPELVEHVRSTQRDIIAVATGLDPVEGTDGLATALAGLARQSDATADIDPATELALTALGPTTARAVWFAGSEALANATKHAPAANRRLELRTDRNEVVLSVVDDGPGPGRAATTTVGAVFDAPGLLGVRDRLAAVGGTLTVTDAHPGTRVEVRVPATRKHLPETGVAADAGHAAAFLASRAPTSEVSP